LRQGSVNRAFFRTNPLIFAREFSVVPAALQYSQGFRRGTGIAVTKDNEKSFTGVFEFTVMRPTPGDDRIVWG
jgi:hypothetical protein